MIISPAAFFGVAHHSQSLKAWSMLSEVKVYDINCQSFLSSVAAPPPTRVAGSSLRSRLRRGYELLHAKHASEHAESLSQPKDSMLYHGA
jgi:hypothetical protein